MGLLGEWARARGHSVAVVRAREIDAWPDPRAADAVVALGSDRSVHASVDPWIAPQLRFLRAAHDAGVPLLGICFGGQALAAALGGLVWRAPAVEIGWIDVRGADGYAGRWFAWHEDAFAAPPGADELARGPSGLQAFRLGRSVALQFHPEATPALVDNWFDGARAAVPNAGPLRAETRAGAADARRRAFALFDRIAADWRA